MASCVTLVDLKPCLTLTSEGFSLATGDWETRSPWDPTYKAYLFPLKAVCFYNIDTEVIACILLVNIGSSLFLYSPNMLDENLPSKSKKNSPVYTCADDE